MMQIGGIIRCFTSTGVVHVDILGVDQDLVASEEVWTRPVI